MGLRRRIAGSVTVVAVVTAGAVAVAQEQVPIKIRVDARVSPNKAGTPAKPQGVKIGVTSYIDMPDDYEPPTVDTVEVWFPKGGRYNGHRFPSCTESTLDRRGPSACPRGAIMGSGRGTATADTVPTFPKITVVNGGRDKVFFYTVMQNPARVQAPVVGNIRKVGGRWSYHLKARIPRSLQIVAGVPILLSKLRIDAGRGDWLATTSCPRSKRWAYHAKVTFSTGAVIPYDGTVPCR